MYKTNINYTHTHTCLAKLMTILETVCVTNPCFGRSPSSPPMYTCIVSTTRARETDREIERHSKPTNRENSRQVCVRACACIRSNNYCLSAPSHVHLHHQHDARRSNPTDREQSESVRAHAHDTLEHLLLLILFFCVKKTKMCLVAVSYASG